MELSNDHIIYNAEDIHRYFSGKMNAQEMHAMEKASLNDALLADAMDGYLQSSSINTTAGYTALQIQLDELKDKISGKTIHIKKRTNHWWEVAAAVLLLVSGAFAFYKLNQPNPKGDIAVVQKDSTIKISNPDTTTLANAPIKINTDSISHLQTNTIKSDSTLLAKSIALNDRKKTNTFKYRQVPADKEVAFEKTPIVNSPSPFADKTANAKASTQQQSTTSSTSAVFLNQGYLKSVGDNHLLFLGKVTDAENNPIAYADLIINNHQQSKTDAHGLFNLSSTDSIVRLDVSATNYYPKTITINANNTADIKLILKKTTLHKSLSDTAFHQSIVQLLYNSGVEPKEGWEMYRLYLVNQLSNSEYDDGRKVVGETIVQFEINRINQPNNFYFEKSINEDVNNAIENLILTQTEWHFLPNAGVPAKVRLRIVF